MALTPVTLDQLGQGKVAEKVNELISLCLRDLLDRPGETGTRTVSLNIQIQNNPKADPGMLMPVISYNAKHTLPAAKGTANFAYVKDGKVWIEELGEDANQMHLDNVTPMTKENGQNE